MSHKISKSVLRDPKGVLTVMCLKPQQKTATWSTFMPCSRTPKHDMHGKCSSRNTSQSWVHTLSKCSKKKACVT